MANSINENNDFGAIIKEMIDEYPMTDMAAKFMQELDLDNPRYEHVYELYECFHPTKGNSHAVQLKNGEENYLSEILDRLLEEHGVPMDEELAEMDVSVEELFNPNVFTIRKIDAYYNRVNANKRKLNLRF